MWQGGMCGRGCVVCVAGGMHGGGACMVGGVHAMHNPPTPPPQALQLQYTVNERAVCILLECILVFFIFQNYGHFLEKKSPELYDREIGQGNSHTIYSISGKDSRIQKLFLVKKREKSNITEINEYSLWHCNLRKRMEF